SPPRAGCRAVRDSTPVAWYRCFYAPRTGGAYDEAQIRHRELATPLQHDQASRLNRIQAASTGGGRIRYCQPERCPTSTRSTSAIRCASASICKVVRLARAGHDGLADGQVLRMDTSVITALAALAGAAIGGLTSIVASSLTQRAQAREQRLAH